MPIWFCLVLFVCLSEILWWQVSSTAREDFSCIITQTHLAAGQACCHCCVKEEAGAWMRRRRHRLAVIDSALLFCERQNGRWRTVAMRTPPFSLLNPGQPRPRGAPSFCQRVSTFSSLLSEFWLNLNAKEKILRSKLSQWSVISKRHEPCKNR